MRNKQNNFNKNIILKTLILSTAGSSLMIPTIPVIASPQSSITIKEVNGNNGNVKVLEKKRRMIQHKVINVKGGETMINFIKKLFKRNNNLLINLNNVNKTLSMSMAGNGNCSDCC